jgi:hypothetical protein
LRNGFVRRSGPHCPVAGTTGVISGRRAKRSSITAAARMLAGIASICLLATAATAGASKDLEQSEIFLNDCSSHFGQLEHDAREVARDFCADLGGVDQLEPFAQSEELIRENEYSEKYSCTVRSRVECYEDE